MRQILLRQVPSYPVQQRVTAATFHNVRRHLLTVPASDPIVGPISDKFKSYGILLTTCPGTESSLLEELMESRITTATTVGNGCLYMNSSDEGSPKFKAYDEIDLSVYEITRHIHLHCGTVSSIWLNVASFSCSGVSHLEKCLTHIKWEGLFAKTHMGSQLGLQLWMEGDCIYRVRRQRIKRVISDYVCSVHFKGIKDHSIIHHHNTIKHAWRTNPACAIDFFILQPATPLERDYPVVGFWVSPRRCNVLMQLLSRCDHVCDNFVAPTAVTPTTGHSNLVETSNCASDCRSKSRCNNLDPSSLWWSLTDYHFSNEANSIRDEAAPPPVCAWGARKSGVRKEMDRVIGGIQSQGV